MGAGHSKTVDGESAPPESCVMTAEAAMSGMEESLEADVERAKNDMLHSRDNPWINKDHVDTPESRHDFVQVRTHHAAHMSNSLCPSLCFPVDGRFSATS